MRTCSNGIVLAYCVSLPTTQVKSDMLALLASHFKRLHARALERAFAHIWMLDGRMSLRGLSQKGEGEFSQRAMQRAFNDLTRTMKACRTTGHEFALPYLRSEIITAAEVQRPRNTSAFDLWVHIEGLARWCQLYLPAKGHRALNRALVRPGARLAQQAEIIRTNGAWYARIFVHVPAPKPYAAIGVLGCDVGVRKSLCTSDGQRGRDLRPVLARLVQRRADQQRRGIEKRNNQHQRRWLNHDARRIVSVARKSGRAIAIEDPARLIRWRQHAARHFGQRVQLLAKLEGIPVVLVPPPYTSQTCHRCGSRESTVRLREEFWCGHCRVLIDADVNAAKTIARMASAFGRGAEKRETVSSPYGSI